MAGIFAMLFYKMLVAVATSFANKPVTSDNITVINLSAAVRTLVLGSITLGTGVFAIAAVGLTLLSWQMIWQRFTGQSPVMSEASENQGNSTYELQKSDNMALGDIHVNCC